MDENKPAAKDDSVLNTIARTVGTTAGIIVSKERVVARKKKAVARKRPVKVKRAAKRATGGRAKVGGN